MAIGNLRRITDIAKSTNSQELVDSHRYVIQFYENRNKIRRRAHDFVRGKQHSEDELEQYRIKRKAPIVYNQLKTSERTILGMFLQNKYDIKFTAVEPGDQDMSDVLEQLRIWESNRNDDLNKDLSTVRDAWAGGTAYQECWVETAPGKDPVIRTQNLNPFAVYFDPNSKDLISRKDAAFVDVDSWLTEEEMVEKWPESADFIKEGLRAYSPNSNGYEAVNKAIDQDHESRIERNGTYRVTERYFRLNRKVFFYLNEKENVRTNIDKEDLEAYKADYPSHRVQSESKEELWLAIACEAVVQGLAGSDYKAENQRLKVDNEEDEDAVDGLQYLYLGPYHSQPVDPADGKVIWPIIEMVAESLNGEPQGFVEHEFDPQSVINSMIANKVHSAKHASSQSKLIDYTAFKDENEAKAASKYHSDADRAFQVKPGRLSDAMAPIEHKQVTQDNDDSLGLAMEFLDKISSTPPAMQGQNEGNVSGVLNAQRIEQSHIQLQVLIKNFRQFLRTKNMLRYAYWRQYYTNEMVFRVLEPSDEMKQNGQDFMVLNQQVPAKDPYGYEIPGEVEVLNDINSMVYDIVVDESQKSTTYRYKTQSQLAEMMQSPAVQNDPVLSAYLFEEWAMLSDVNDKLKDKIKAHSSILVQWNQQQQQMQLQQQQQQLGQGDLQQQQQMQQMAQAEAEQTAMASPTPEYSQPMPGEVRPDQALQEQNLTPEQLQMMLEGGY